MQLYYRVAARYTRDVKPRRSVVRRTRACRRRAIMPPQKQYATALSDGKVSLLPELSDSNFYSNSGALNSLWHVCCALPWGSLALTRGRAIPRLFLFSPPPLPPQSLTHPTPTP
eukprot:6196301-Pleurochrysis_carterae.AAC.1